MATDRCDLESVTDFITGRKLPYHDDEYIRQKVERFLIENKGYAKEDVEVSGILELTVGGAKERCRLDLVIHVGGVRFMLLKCARGGLVTRERETLAAARLAGRHQIPLAVVTNGKDAELLDTITGKVLGDGLEAIPSKNQALNMFESTQWVELPPQRREKEERILLAFEAMKCPSKCELL